MGNNQSSFSQNRCKSALLVLETIRPRVPATSPSQLYLLKYVHAYIKSASSPTQHALNQHLLDRKLRKYIKSATGSPLANYRDTFFTTQFDDDQRQLSQLLNYVNVCVDDLELYEQILTAVRRKEVLCLGEFIIERPKGQAGRVKNCQMKMRKELESSIANGPVGGYASLKKDKPPQKEPPWWEEGKPGGAGAPSKVANRPTSMILGAPDNLRIRNDQVPKPLFHSKSTKETRSSQGKLQHPGFSFQGVTDPSNFTAPPTIRGTNGVSSIASAVLGSRDWLDSTSQAINTASKTVGQQSHPATAEEEPESKIETKIETKIEIKANDSRPTTSRSIKQDIAYPNLRRNSWTSSIHTTASSLGGDTTISSSVFPSPPGFPTSLAPAPLDAVLPVPLYPVLNTAIFDETVLAGDGDMNCSVADIVEHYLDESVQKAREDSTASAGSEESVESNATAVSTSTTASSAPSLGPDSGVKIDTDKPARTISSASTTTTATTTTTASKNTLPAIVQEDDVFTNSATPIANQFMLGARGNTYGENMGTFGFGERNWNEQETNRKGKAKTPLDSEEKFEALYRVAADFDTRIDNVRVRLDREKLVEVRVGKLGSFVKVEAWVPLGEVYGALDFENVRQIRRRK